MKTNTELKQLLNDISWYKSGYVVDALKPLADAELVKLARLHFDLSPSGYRFNLLRNKIFNELFSRHGLGNTSGNHLSFKQRDFLKSLGLAAQKKIVSNVADNDLDRTDKLILQYLKEGNTQAEISDLLKIQEIKPNSLSIIEKRLKAIREKYNAKSMFHLAVILYGK